MNDPQELNPAAPPTLKHVIGQQRAVQQLQLALDAYDNDRAVAGNDVAFPHFLLVGPPGTGKSLLASIVAAELCTKFHEELAQNISSPGHLQGLLMLAEAGDVIFVDEIHELPPTCQVTLYRSLEERKLFLGRDRKSILLPPHCFAAATTDEFRLSKPLRDRFRVVLRLQHYSDSELVQLLTQRCKRMTWPIEEEAIKNIASRGRGTPRLAIRLLESARRVSRAEAADIITHRHLERACDVEGIDTLGLDPTERQYLEILKDSQGPVRLNVIATRLALPRKTIESVVENDLLRLGLISKSEQGRMLTAIGSAHLSQKTESKVSES